MNNEQNTNTPDRDRYIFLYKEGDKYFSTQANNLSAVQERKPLAFFRFAGLVIGLLLFCCFCFILSAMLVPTP